MKVNVAIELDTDDLFQALNKFGGLDRAKFDKLVLTPAFQEFMAYQMPFDFYEAQEQDASGIEEGFFAAALEDFED